MIIVNADDWGRSRAETDAALACYRAGSISSATAMVFMQDSERGADLANEAGIDVGLHLNLTQQFSGSVRTGSLQESHGRIAGFLNLGKYAPLLYHPGLRAEFRSVFQAQLEEFVRLFGHQPSHVDGHRHQHLCMNMLMDGVIPSGTKVRRSFYFWPNEKGLIKRGYHGLVDNLLARRYRMTDYFFALSQSIRGDRMKRVMALAQHANVEVMTHPANQVEYDYLLSGKYLDQLGELRKGTYALI